MREFRLDFSHRPKEKSTVAALREESPDVDLTSHTAGGTPPRQDDLPVTSQDITTQLASAFQVALVTE